MSRMTTLNPEKISFMNLADTDLLVEAATGEIDLNEVARDILAKRGLDQRSGRWIGFEAARKQFQSSGSQLVDEATKEISRPRG